MLYKLLLLAHLLCVSALQFCPKECACSGAVVNCADRRLKHVPKMPSDVERMCDRASYNFCTHQYYCSDLQKNHIARIERGSFNALSQLRVL